jgi:hypothetical protein
MIHKATRSMFVSFKTGHPWPTSIRLIFYLFFHQVIAYTANKKSFYMPGQEKEEGGTRPGYTGHLRNSGSGSVTHKNRSP